MVSGPDFLQMVFKVKKAKKLHRRDKLVECEVINDWEAADQFRSQFQTELNKFNLKLQVPAYHKKNSSAEKQHGSEYAVETEENAVDLEQRYPILTFLPLQVMSNLISFNQFQVRRFSKCNNEGTTE